MRCLRASRFDRLKTTLHSNIEQLNTNTLIILNFDRSLPFSLYLSLTRRVIIKWDTFFFSWHQWFIKFINILWFLNIEKNWLKYWYFYGFNSAPFPLAEILLFTNWCWYRFFQSFNHLILMFNLPHFQYAPTFSTLFIKTFAIYLVQFDLLFFFLFSITN